MFTKTFFDIIIEGLEKDGIVKINGLGTFKAVEVANRTSVNVNTGERFEIKGHKKLTFLPADRLKETINQPFAMFEPVEVDDDYIDEENEEFVEQTIKEDSTDIQEKQTDEDKESEKTEENYNDNPSERAEEIVEQNNEAEITKPSDDTVPSKEAIDNTDLKNNNESDVKQDKNKNRGWNKKPITLFILLFIAAGSSIAYYFMRNNKVDIVAKTEYRPADIVKKPQSSTTVLDTGKIVKSESTVSDTISTDLQSVQENKEEYKFVLVEELAQTALSQISLQDTTTYIANGDIATHKVGADETLTKISYKYYNDKRLWPYIVKHNKMSDHNQLAIGMELKIPRLQAKNIDK